MTPALGQPANQCTAHRRAAGSTLTVGMPSPPTVPAGAIAAVVDVTDGQTVANSITAHLGTDNATSRSAEHH